MKFTDARDQFFAWLGPRKLAANSLTAYRQDLEVIASELGDPAKLTIKNLTRETVRKAFGVYAGTHAKASIARVHSTWTKFFEFLVADGIVEGSPMAAIPKPKLDARSPRPLDGWEDDLALKLLTKLAKGSRGGQHPWPELDVAVVATLFATGLRASELLALNIGAIEGRPPDQIIRTIGKGNKPRTIPVEPELDLVLGIYLETRRERFVTWKPKDADPLFVGAKPNGKDGGKRMTTAQLHYLLETGLSTAGYGDARQKGSMAHAFRHTYGTELAAQGAPIMAIRKLMGHSSVATTQGYIDSLAKDERSAAARNTIYGALTKIGNTSQTLFD